MPHITKLGLWGKSRYVVIPIELVRQLKWRGGDPLYLTAQNGVIVIQPVPLPQVPTVTTDSAEDGLTT